MEECGPSSQHEYVPFEQSQLNVVVPMIAEGVQNDHFNDAFMQRVWVESGHDINMEHVEDEGTDIERFIINWDVGDDDNDDNALDDDHGDQEHSTLSSHGSSITVIYCKHMGQHYCSG